MSRRTHAQGAEALGADLDRLDDEVTRYGRALEMAVAARAAGCFVPSMLVEGGDIARGAGRLADRAVRQGESREHDRARALRKVSGHLHALDLALDDRGLGHEALEVVARALAAALDVFARPDIHGLARLQDRVDLLLDHIEHHPGLRGMAQHLLGIGTAAEFSWENHPHLRPAGAVREIV
jgi:hypothetical protein